MCFLFGSILDFHCLHDGVETAGSVLHSLNFKGTSKEMTTAACIEVSLYKSIAIPPVTFLYECLPRTSHSTAIAH